MTSDWKEIIDIFKDIVDLSKCRGMTFIYIILYILYEYMYTHTCARVNIYTYIYIYSLCIK